ncbi:DUF6879 family protein [Streptomyces sp. KL115B]|uniref:DUF6879 family protein n=1 Tax=Streptomyces sp. KL115B TaxID=3045154 RepID=UPI003531B96B
MPHGDGRRGGGRRSARLRCERATQHVGDSPSAREWVPTSFGSRYRTRPTDEVGTGRCGWCLARAPGGPGSLVAEAVGRGVSIRRARIVSEPVSEYIRYEHSGTFTNIAAGEQVRWLPRRRTSDIALPGNDFWLLDDRLVRWNHFAGDGSSQGPEGTTDRSAVKLCGEAFETVWDRGVPHDQYEIR